jgi:FtsP/CotA-like multicopper oxidase with cupredoxin domain
MIRSLPSPLTPFVDPLPLPARLSAREHEGRLSIAIEAATHSFHRDLPQSRVWTYGGSIPGPTIEAERGRPVRLEWHNRIEGTLPVAVTVTPEETDRDGVPVQCVPGLSGGERDPSAAALPGFSTVHLHGGVTAAPYDGWTENIFAPGQHAVHDYAMDQRAALLWYHDHVMGVTKLSVYSGLAGLWIVRDELERRLELPEGPPFEIPMLLQDRNFGEDEDGNLTGELVHKTDPGTMEAFAPFTTVNGKIWPYLDVSRATYRLRVINGSNARTFRLALLRDGKPELERIRQIGTDGGLLAAPVAVPSQGLVLAPAERADLLVDFSDLTPGTELTLLNTAAAPFAGEPFPPERAGDATDLDGLLPYPQVMLVRVVAGDPVRTTVPERLDVDLAVPSADQLAAATERTVALVEQELEGATNMLTMRELAAVAHDDDTDQPLLTLVDPDGEGGETISRLRVAASHFEDTVTFFPTLGEWEIWRLINLSGDTHPIHLHLASFHVLTRRAITVDVPADAIGDRALAGSVRCERDPADTLKHAVDDNERGLKDTVRVNPNEIVEIAVRFTTFSGRYMYHCHMLEHEDRDMMRPFVVMPPSSCRSWLER